MSADRDEHHERISLVHPHELHQGDNNNANARTHEGKENRVFLVFCLGFTLSTIIALIAYGLSLGVVQLIYPHDESSSNSIDAVSTISTSSCDNTTFQTSTTPETTNFRRNSATILPTTGSPSTTASPVTPREKCEKRIVLYHALWATSNITEKQMSKLTHLILLPIPVFPNGTLYFRSEAEKERFNMIVSKAKQLPGLKVMFSNYNFGIDYDIVSEVLADSMLKSVLIGSINSFVNQHSLDGVDFTLRFPITESDFTNLNSFFGELRDNVSNPTVQSEKAAPFIISTVLSHIASEYAHINSEYIDFLTIETNTYYGPFHNAPFVGSASPLYSNQAKQTTRNVDQSIRSYSCMTKQPNKLNIFVDFYGTFWENVITPENPSDTLWMSAEAINGSVRGDYLKRQNFLKNGWDVTKALWNDDSKTPYIWKAEKRKYLTFENVRSLEEKIEYAVEKNLGGFAIWAMENDEDSFKLLDVLANAALCSGNNNTVVKYDCK